MKKIKYLLIMISIFGKIWGTSSSEYWNQIKVRADKIYRGVDMNFTFNLSVGESEGTNDGVESKASITVPLFSSSENRAKAEEKRSFLKEGAELVKQFEVSVNIIEVLEEELKLKKATMYEDGATGIESFIKLKSSLIEAKATRTEVERKLEAMLKY